MRIFLASCVTLFLVSLAISSGPFVKGQEPVAIPDGTDVTAPPANAPKIDPSKVKFLLAKKGCTDPASLVGPPNAYGVVDSGLDLSEEVTATQLLQMGIAFALDKCPSATEVWVYVRPGDPAQFMDSSRGFGFVRGSLIHYPADVVGGGWQLRKPGFIVGYRNFPKAQKVRQTYYAEKERQREAELQQQRQAEQKAAARWAAFLQKYRVKHVVTIDQLTANPFIYKGQVVATGGTFERMNSPTQGIFSARGRKFVISGISTARFTRTGTDVILAGRVLGNIEVKPGPMVLPHLSFVAIYTAN